MPDDVLIGQQLDEYHLDTLLGQGGMARVYRGLDVRLKRWVAIKVIDTPFRTDSDYVKRFEREAQAIAQLEHPHIVRLYRYGEANGLLYMAMQFVEGASLSQVLTTYRAEGEYIELDEANRIAREVCLALDYAHSKGVIHRDIKPANIILDKQGRAILADFGLALLTDVGTQGQVFGTARYMAPEQAMSSANAVSQSDLYSVGIMLYEMFTGELPFDAPQPLDVVMLHMTTPPPPPREFRPELSPTLEAVLLKTLAKEPEDRYPSGVALADALAQALQNTQAKIPSPLPSAGQLRFTIPERVAVSLAKRPLPPIPAMMPNPPSPLEETQPASKPLELGLTLAESVEAQPVSRQPEPGLASPRDVQSQPFSRLPEPRVASTANIELQPQPAPTPAGVATSSPPSTNWRFPLYIGIGIGLVMLVGLTLIAVVGGLLWLRSQANNTAVQPSPNVTTSVVLETTTVAVTGVENSSLITSTIIPAQTAAPVNTPAPPTATPLPEPQLIADSVRDFSGSPGVWEYLSSPSNKDEFKPMKFEERKYGACWYDKDYIRICQGSGHPGNGADVAWLWKSQVSGHVRVLVSAHKIDRGGDGVTILAYHNTSGNKDASQPVEGLILQGEDTEGVNQKLWFEVDVGIGDSFIFVLKKNRSAEYDHTAFQAQIYQQ